MTRTRYFTTDGSDLIRWQRDAEELTLSYMDGEGKWVDDDAYLIDFFAEGQAKEISIVEAGEQAHKRGGVL